MQFILFLQCTGLYSLHWTRPQTQSWTVFVCFNFFFLACRWTGLCLRLLPGSKWRAKWFLLNILFSFTETAARKGRFWHCSHSSWTVHSFYNTQLMFKTGFDSKNRYQCVWVGFLYTSTFRLLSSPLCTAESYKASRLPFTSSWVNLIQWSALLMVVILAQVLFTYLYRGLVFNAFFSTSSLYRLAGIGGTEDPMAKPVAVSLVLELGGVEAKVHRSAQICREFRLVLSGSVWFCKSFICGSWCCGW